MAGLVFNIQRLSVHDGPGVRTLVFFKGCPLRCRWCSNPESWRRRPELACNLERCIGTDECGFCLDACPKGAIEKDGPRIRVDREACDHCGDCVRACPAQALFMFGEWMAKEDILHRVEEDTVFMSRSGGGLTLGGGEPLLQSEFVHDLLKTAKSRGLHTAIETCGAVPWNMVAEGCRFADFLVFDIKSMNEAKHRAYTGAGNGDVLSNLNRLGQRFPEKEIMVRTPVIPGFNDTEEDIAAIISFIRPMNNIKNYELLPYHRFGVPKYDFLGKSYPLDGLEPPSAMLMKRLNDLVTEYFPRKPENDVPRPGQGIEFME